MSLPSVTVVICVHNALDDVKNCLQSVEKTDYPAENLKITIVDDGSDEDTAHYLAAFADRVSHAKVIRRDVAGGYTVAANVGVQNATGELIALLNSDTVVPAGWLRKIAKRFEMAPDVGLVGPLSNAASWQSVPERTAPEGGWAINELPAHISVDQMDQMVEDAARAVPGLVRLPLLNGFCYTMRREVVEKIGPFDENAFPRGFGEEDDFCLRATNAGFGIALTQDTYVFHAKSKSYGSDRRKELSFAGQEALRQKHGATRMKRAIDTMKMNPYLETMREELTAVLRNR